MGNKKTVALEIRPITKDMVDKLQVDMGLNSTKDVIHECVALMYDVRIDKFSEIVKAKEVESFRKSLAHYLGR